MLLVLTDVEGVAVHQAARISLSLVGRIRTTTAERKPDNNMFCLSKLG
jgi:hypothetical protein